MWSRSLSDRRVDQVCRSVGSQLDRGELTELNRTTVEERTPQDNAPCQSLWLSDQIWAQTSQEVSLGGFHHQWPGWASHMIGCTRADGHVDMSAPRAAQLAVLLANENRRFFNAARFQASWEIQDLEERVNG